MAVLQQLSEVPPRRTVQQGGYAALFRGIGPAIGSAMGPAIGSAIGSAISHALSHRLSHWPSAQ